MLGDEEREHDWQQDDEGSDRQREERSSSLPDLACTPPDGRTTPNPHEQGGVDKAAQHEPNAKGQGGGKLFSREAPPNAECPRPGSQSHGSSYADRQRQEREQSDQHTAPQLSCGRAACL